LAHLVNGSHLNNTPIGVETRRKPIGTRLGRESSGNQSPSAGRREAAGLQSRHQDRYSRVMTAHSSGASAQADAMQPARSVLETFENPYPQRDYLIESICSEFTSLCPKTGQPDFATLTIRYVPDRLCVELKSLKLYLQQYRNHGAFYESVTNRILDDLVAVMQPRSCELVAAFTTRGGIRTNVHVRFPPP
jgi:7-cyano-7-deazaguanine reductase